MQATGNSLGSSPGEDMGVIVFIGSSVVHLLCAPIIKWATSLAYGQTTEVDTAAIIK